MAEITDKTVNPEEDVEFDIWAAVQCYRILLGPKWYYNDKSEAADSLRPCIDGGAGGGVLAPDPTPVVPELGEREQLQDRSGDH